MVGDNRTLVGNFQLSVLRSPFVELRSRKETGCDEIGIHRGHAQDGQCIIGSHRIKFLSHYVAQFFGRG